MTTFLDLLVVVGLSLAAVSAVSVALMFLVKNRRVQQVCLWLVCALSLYVGTVGLRILWPGFLGQAVIALLAALAGIGAFVLERLSKDCEKRFLIARILAAVSLIVGLLNALA